MHIKDPFLSFTYGTDSDGKYKFLWASVSDVTHGECIVKDPFELAEILHARNCDSLWVDTLDCNGLYLLDPRRPALNDYTHVVLGSNAHGFLEILGLAMQKIRKLELLTRLTSEGLRSSYALRPHGPTSRKQRTVAAATAPDPYLCSIQQGRPSQAHGQR